MSSAGQQATREEAFLASRAPNLPEETAPEYPQAWYYRARYYDTATARFASEDPLTFDGMTSNFYTYVANDPLDYWDPLGLRPLTVCEKVKLAPYIPLIDLNNADVIENEWPPKVAKFFPIPFLQNEAGITLGNKIYIRPGQYDSTTLDGMMLLGHELVHVGQYRTGELTKNKYLRELIKHGSGPKNKYEAPGYAMQDDIEFSLPAYLLALKQKGCNCAR
jgi:RHS repeat-associated protein